MGVFLLNIHNLYVKYSENKDWIIEDNSFTISKGELVLVVGASGSGKSTLAKAILGVIPYFERGMIKGSIMIDNKENHKYSRKALIKKIGYIPQYPADFTIQMVVEDEIAFPLENIGLSRDEIEKRLLIT